MSFEITADVWVRDTTGRLAMVGKKTFKPADEPLNKWVDRPKGVVIRPPLTSATVTKNDNVWTDTLAEGSLGYLVSIANDVQHSSQGVAMFSSVFSAGHGWSVTPDNFLQSCVCFAARKLVKPTWLNDRDEFNVPDQANPSYNQFALDAVVYTLFHGSNQTSSLGNVEYKGVTYDIRNEFFWVSPSFLADAPGLPRATYQQCKTAKPPFLTTWARDKHFSLDARQVLDLATRLVSESACKRASALKKFQLERWDAGWYQIRNGLYGKDVPFQPTPAMTETWNEFQTAYRALTARLRPLIYDLGMLPREDVMEVADE